MQFLKLFEKLARRRLLTDDADFLCRQIPLPEQVQYLEKRVNYRIQTRLTEKPVVQIATTNEEPLLTRCTDISENGACLLIPGDNPPVNANDFIECTIHLPGLKPIECSAVVRYQSFLTNTRKGKISKIGIEFSQLHESTKKEIHAALMKMQRHNLRSNINP